MNGVHQGAPRSQHSLLPLMRIVQCVFAHARAGWIVPGFRLRAMPAGLIVG